MGRFKLGRILAATALVTVGAAVVPATQAAPAAAATLPSLRVGDVTVVEGDAGQASVSVPVDLSAPTNVKVTATYTIVGDSATAGTAGTAGSDFAARHGKITFAPGTATKRLSVVVFGDTDIEPDDVIDVQLSSPINATVDDNEGTVTITNDDSDTVTGLQVNIGDVEITASEGGTHIAALPITLSRPAPSMIKVNFSVSCGIDPTSGLVIKQHGTLTFAQGQQSKLLKFQVPLDQTIDQAMEFLATLTVKAGPVVPNASVGQGTIFDGSDPGGPPVGSIGRESVSSAGTEAQFTAAGLCGGNSVRGSEQPAISADGRYVAFISDAVNLVPGDTNGLVDAFVHDRLTGSTERVSFRSDGSQIPGDGSNDLNIMFPSISGTGRYVTFVSERTLTNDAPNNSGEMAYVYDRTTGTTELISRATDGTPAGSDWYAPVSDDGRYVFFGSEGTLGTSVVRPTAAQSQNDMNLFVRDRTLGTTALVTGSYNGGWTNVMAPSISADGRYVLWQSDSPNFVPGDTNGIVDFFVRDMQTGTTTRVDLTDAGQQISGPDAYDGMGPGPYDGVISADGRFVAFTTGAANVVAGGPPYVQGVYNLYVRDRQLGTTEIVPDTPANVRGPSVPDISGDGRYVTYQSMDLSTDLMTASRYDRATGETTVVGEALDGTLPDGNVGDGFEWQRGAPISRDGKYVVFSSDATNLVPNDMNDAFDIFEQRVN